jgi:DNA polymerase-3 subunit epsilon
MKLFTCIDTETTGLNKNTDRIIQLAVSKFDENFKIIADKVWYIKPSGVWKINPDAEAVHKISEEFINENGVSLKSIVAEFLELIKDTTILTYNGSTFDISFIQREFEREGLDTGFENHEFIDGYDIERRMNSNKLSDVYRRYYGEDFDNAHDALADVHATIKVFEAQCNRHGDAIDAETGKGVILESTEQITKMMQTSPEGFIYYDKDNVLRFRIGKFKEYPVVDVCKNNPSYIKWLFTPNNGDNICTNITKKAIKNAYYEQK